MAKARAAVSAEARELSIFLKVSKYVLSVLSKTQLCCGSCLLEADGGWSEWSRSSSRALPVKRKGHISPGGLPGDRLGGHGRNRSYVQSMREQL